MTTITIQKTRNNEYSAICFDGHAGFADSGKDIVCAAVSVLVINMINSVETLTSEVINVMTNEKKGTIICEFNEHPSKEAVLLVDSMILGLKEIEHQYGKKYVKLKIEEV